MNMPVDTRFGTDLFSPTGPETRPEWSMRLVVDVALGSSEESILEAHNLTYTTYQKILSNPQFVLALDKLKKDLEKEGASFRLKAQLQADFYLAKVHEMIMAEETDEKVKTRLIEDVVRWAGLDEAPPVNGGGMGGFSISFNFGQHEPRGLTIDAEPN